MVFLFKFFVTNFPKMSINICADKKWAEIKQTENNKRSSTPNGQLNDVNGHDSNPKANTTGTGTGTNTSTNINSNTRPLPMTSNTRVMTPAAAQIATTLASSQSQKPMIRVKAIESMKEVNRPNSINVPKAMSASGNGSAPKIVNSVRVLSSPTTQIRTSIVQKPSTVAKDQSTSNVVGNSDQPVKLWNNVMQKNTDKTLDYLVVSNKEDASKDNAVFCIKPTEELIENAKENGSALKIDQVYECVSDEFVEDLLIEKRAHSSTVSNTSSSPLLDTLVNEVQNTAAAPKQTNKDTAKSSERKVKFSPTEEDCLDYRCNMCLQFNQSFAEYKSHMMQWHCYNHVCDTCRGVFKSRHQYHDHLDASMKCVEKENASRSFVCIVDPPVILMRNGKVFAFRCKHCNVAFHNQRNYVQHAQRHAKLFRCKTCPSAKSMSASFMQKHLAEKHQ